MKRLIFGLLTTIPFLLATDQAGAGELWHKFWLSYHRNKAWPEPFQYMDRAATARPFGIMMNNGWRLNNTVVDEMFDPKNNELNGAGKAHLRWIATQAPMHRRSVFVLAGLDAEATNQRMEAVQSALEEISGPGPTPPVMLTYNKPMGLKAGPTVTTLRRYESGQPAPELPPMVKPGL